VSDQCQKQGHGIELLRCAAQIVGGEKLGRVFAEMLHDNLAMQAISQKTRVFAFVFARFPPRSVRYSKCDFQL
jgi:hypothetical protein